MSMEEKKEPVDKFKNIKIINTLNSNNAHLSAFGDVKNSFKEISKKINDKARYFANLIKEAE